MITTTPRVQVWVATAPVDMRQSFDRLAEHVRAFLGHDPLGGHLFVFRNRSGERVKILWWDRNGLVLYYKRLERGTFQFPSSADKTLAIDSAQLVRLLAGMQIVAQAPGMEAREPHGAKAEAAALAGAK
jgi:transposase